MPWFRSSLQGLFLTLKLNQWAFVDQIPEMILRVRAMGFPDVRATQLPSNRQEFFMFARAAHNTNAMR